MNRHLLRLLAAASTTAVVVFITPTAPGAAGPRKPVTITGEILDMGCYISRGLRGAIHRECATRCLQNGVPMGLLAADSTVYILTQNHDRAMDPRAYGPPDPFEFCKQNPSLQMAVTGLLWERKGYKELEVKVAARAPAASPAQGAVGTP